MSIRYKVVQCHLKDSVSSPRRSATPRPSRQRPSHDDCRMRLAKASECTRRAYFCAQRAIASISREESWKVVARIFTLLLCDLCGLARKNSRQLLFSKGRRSLSTSEFLSQPASLGEAQCAKRVTTGLRLATHLRCIQPLRGWQ